MMVCGVIFLSELSFAVPHPACHHCQQLCMLVTCDICSHGDDDDREAAANLMIKM